MIKNEKENKDNNYSSIIKPIYKQIRNGCSRKICYNIFCHNNLVSIKSKNI